MIINKEIKFPFYAKATIFLIGLFALFTMLDIAQGIIVPIIFAIIISILLSPVVNFLNRIGIHRLIAIIITIFLTFLIIAAFGALLISQGSQFIDSWPVIVNKLTLMLNQFITWVSGYFDIDPKSIQEWITKTKGDILNSNSAIIGKTIVSVGSTVVVFLLIPVYIFMILYYRPILLSFIHKIFSKNDQGQLNEVIIQTKTVIQRYLLGLIIEASLIATMEIIALLLLGIEYAILLGIIGAIVNMIPYIGGIVAVSLPMMIALTTKSSPMYAVYIMIIYYVIQLIDNNFIVPKIVASKVKINALCSVIAVLAGNALWGVPGMFLSIPLIAIVKVIFDHIEPLKPWGFLLGDTMPTTLKVKHLFKKRIIKTN